MSLSESRATFGQYKADDNDNDNDDVALYIRNPEMFEFNLKVEDVKN